MTQSVFNWTYADVVKFLKKYKFRLVHAEGSHHFYQGAYKGILRQVCVPFHNAKAFKPRTFKGMIEQSGIPKEEWLA